MSDKKKDNKYKENDEINAKNEVINNNKKVNNKKNLEEKNNDDLKYDSLTMVIEESKIANLGNDVTELSEQELREIQEFKTKLKHLDISENHKDEDSHKEEIVVQKPIESEEKKDDGDISYSAISSVEQDLKDKIALIKSELKADQSFSDKFKNLFKSKKQKLIEEELIKRKALKLNKNKKEIKYIQTNFKSTIGLFATFYSRNDMKWRIMVAILVGIIMSFSSIIFVQNTGVVVTGMSGIFQGIARITKVGLNKAGTLDNATITTIYNLMFYGMYLLANIPLIIFSYKKTGKNFTILSSIPVVLSNVIPLLINLIPGTQNLFIFGKTLSTEVFAKLDGNVIHFFEEPSQLSNYGVTLLTFKFEKGVVSGTNIVGMIQDAPKFISMFIYTIGVGIVNGAAISMIMAVGGSTGGLDFISFYFAYKKNKSLGPVLLTFNISSVLLTTMLGSYISGIIVDPSKYWSYEYFFSQNLLTGIIYSLVLMTMVGNLFPKDKVVKITIYSSKVYKIRNHLYSKNFNHSLTINNTTGGYSMTDQKNIEIICMFIEIPKILRELRYCDENGLITITRIKGIDGRLTIASGID